MRARYPLPGGHVWRRSGLCEGERRATMPTMDFEAYLPTEIDAAARKAALAELAHWEDKGGIAMAVVMPSPTERPDNRALLETLAGDPRWVPCCQVNPRHEDAVARMREAVAGGCRMLKL